MITGCHFENGAIIVADSRITWETEKEKILNDFAQKILPITNKGALAFSGDVVLAEWVSRQIRKHILKNHRHNLYSTLAPYMARISKRSFKEYTKNLNPKGSIALILGGVDITGKFSMYACKSPDFRLHDAAKKLSEKHYAAAAKIYRAMGMEIINKGKSKHYKYALNNFEKAKKLYRKTDLEKEWLSTVETIRGNHSRKYSFIEDFEDVVSGKSIAKEPSFLEVVSDRWKKQIS